MVDKDAVIKEFFHAKGFKDMWPDIKMKYENLGFHIDQMGDDEIIEEFTDICQQLRKYMFSKQDQIISKDTYGEMADVAEELIGKAQEYAKDRKMVVYYFMRDEWLEHMCMMLRYAHNLSEVIEEDEDAE